MKALKIVLPILGLAVIAAIAFRIERRETVMEADRAIVAKANDAVSKALAADAELIQRYGPFLRLDGSGHTRLRYAWQLVERIEMSRKAVFEKGNVALKVVIYCGESRDLGKFQVGHVSWKPDPSRAQAGDFLEVDVAVDFSESSQNSEEPTPRPRILVSVALSADTGTVFLGRQSDKVEVWDRATSENVRTIEGSFGMIRDLFPSASSALLVIDTENRIIVVDSATGVFAGSLSPGHPVRGPRAAISADGRVLIRGYYRHVPGNGGPMAIEMAEIRDLRDGTSSMLAVEGPATPSPQSVYTPKAKSVFLSPDGLHALLVLDGPGTPMQCWNLGTKAMEWTREFSGDVRSTYEMAVFTPSMGKLCVYRDSYAPHAPEIWNITSGEVETVLELPESEIWKDYREYYQFGQFEPEPTMIVSPDERLLAVGLNNGRVLVWHLPSGRLAGLVYNTDWELEGSLANEENLQWVDPPPPRSGYKGIIIGTPFRGEKLAAIGFDASNRLIGISLHPRVAWVWRSDPKWLRSDHGDAPAGGRNR